MAIVMVHMIGEHALVAHRQKHSNVKLGIKIYTKEKQTEKPHVSFPSLRSDCFFPKPVFSIGFSLYIFFPPRCTLAYTQIVLMNYDYAHVVLFICISFLTDERKLVME